MTRNLGSCDCGGVMYELTGTPGTIVACHCDQCRKSSGHYWAGASVERQNFKITNQATLKWFQSTDVGHRGFCTGCGSSIFWYFEGTDKMIVAAGTLETPTHRKVSKHIFVSEKGDYYDIDDGLPQAAQFDLDAGDPMG
jgi:hypothetical protein